MHTFASYKDGVSFVESVNNVKLCVLKLLFLPILFVGSVAVALRFCNILVFRGRSTGGLGVPAPPIAGAQ
jgi:hypothetical protein